jgi:hypothetical protein
LQPRKRALAEAQLDSTLALWYGAFVAMRPHNRRTTMARKNTARKTQAERLADIVPMPTEGELALVTERAEATNQLVAEAIAEAEADHVADHEEPNAPRGKSVVPLGYKKTYAERAVRSGLTSKAAKRQNGDWLAQELLAECVPDGKTFDLARFCAICEANGVGDPMVRWPNRNNGWEGRLRMSGAIVLRGLVAKSGVFRTPDTELRLAELPEAGAFLAKWDGRNG